MENKKKRIAVCFYGQVRFYEGLNSLYSKWNDLFENFKIDFFISTWDDMDKEKITLNFRKTRFFNYNKITKGWEIGNTRKMAYLFSNAVRLKQEYELEQDFGYDWVFMTRPDIIYEHQYFEKSIEKLSNLDSSKPTVGVLDFPSIDENGHQRIMMDYGFLFSSEAADIHGSLYNYFYLLKKYKKVKDREYREGGHWIHTFYFLLNNFHIEQINLPSIMVRPYRDLETIKQYIDSPELFKKVGTNACTWKLIDGNTAERDGVKIPFKERIVK